MPDLYAGLDVSYATTSICVVDAKGKIVHEALTDTAPEAIATVLKPYKRQLKCVGQETGNLAPWLEGELARAKYPMVCLDPLRTSLALGARLNKTDKNDARGLAQLLVGGTFTRSHTKSVEAIRIRAVLALRESIVRRGRDMARVIDMVERRLIVDQPKRRKVALRSTSREAVVDSLASTREGIAALTAQRRKLDKVIRELAKDSDVCQRLMTIPGVGPITALSFIASVDDPTRFASSRNLGAYFGLTPRAFQSGVSSRSGRISHRGNSDVRKALFIAAFCLLNRSRKDCALRRWGLRLAETKGRKKAYIAVARKLAVLMHHLWITGQDFDPSCGTKRARAK